MLTLNVFVTSGAAFQLPSPAWLAAMLTCPDVENVRFVPPAIDAGPEAAAKETPSPLEAVAASPTSFVVS